MKKQYTCTCPYCGEDRIIHDRKYNGKLRPCRACALHQSYENKDVTIARPYSKGWDHDPWATGQLGWWVLKNALVDGVAK